MNRPKMWCHCCELMVELYSDGLSGGGHPYRCGNCFEGISETQYAHAQKVHAEVAKLEEQKRKLLEGAYGVNHKPGGH